MTSSNTLSLPLIMFEPLCRMSPLNSKNFGALPCMPAFMHACVLVRVYKVMSVQAGGAGSSGETSAYDRITAFLFVYP